MTSAETTRPAIAVIIPVRDRRAVIRRAVDSVLAQDFAAFELMVVDDGSTDGTAELVEAIADPRLRLVRQEGLGGNAARNRGVAETTAPLLAFLDSDDEFLPDKLSTVVDMFARQPYLGTLLDSYAIVNPARHGGRPEDLINPAIETSEAFRAALLTSNTKARRLRKATSGITVRREVAAAAGLFDETVRRRQDMEFLLRLADAGRCATTRRRLWVKHETPDSITFTGGGFLAASLHMARHHPAYAAHRTRMPADVVIYLWETARRDGFARVRRELGELRREIGTVAATGVVVRGLFARLVDARLDRAPR